MAARAAQALRGRLLGVSASSSHSCIRHLEASGVGLRASTTSNEASVDSWSGLRRASSSLGLGGNGCKRFFRVSSNAQQQSLVTPSEAQGEIAQTAELTREMQLKLIDEARASIFGHALSSVLSCPCFQFNWITRA